MPDENLEVGNAAKRSRPEGFMGNAPSSSKDEMATQQDNTLKGTVLT